jgi:hypothetical protein
MSETERATCTDCGERAPATNTNYTLISTNFGWRLSRRVAPDGTKVAEWRCPACWRKHKASGTSSRVTPNPRPKTQG